MTRIEAVVPMYNEEAGCVSVARGIDSALRATGTDYVIHFMVGGADETYVKLLDSVIDENNEIPARFDLQFDGERGLGTAMRKGFMKVADNANWVLTIDGDGQCVPAEISRFWDSVQVLEVPCDGYDAYFGYQDPATDSRGRVRRFKSMLATRALKARYGMKARSITLNYRLYRGSVIRDVRKYLTSKDFAIQPEIAVAMAKRGYTNIVNVPVSWPPREHGGSKAQLSAMEYLRLLL